MSIKNTIRTIMTTLVIFILGCGYFLYNIERDLSEHEIYQMGKEDSSPTSLHMYYLLINASKKYDIPKHILFNVAYLETGYKGPFHWQYNPYQTSFAGAQGPMQIITRWSHSYAGRTLTPKELRTDLKLNIDVSCKMLVKLKKCINVGIWLLGSIILVIRMLTTTHNTPVPPTITNKSGLDHNYYLVIQISVVYL